MFKRLAVVSLAFLIVAGCSTKDSPLSVLSDEGTPVVVGAVAGPWAKKDIGAVGYKGDATNGNDTFSVMGAGVGINQTADAFHFVYQNLKGPKSIEGQLVYKTRTTAGARSGLMIRRTASGTGARYFGIFMNNAGSLVVMYRKTDGAVPIETAVGTFGTPVFLKLTRSGKEFGAYYSLDGAGWQNVAKASICMDSIACYGMAVTSGITTALNAAIYNLVTVKDGATIQVSPFDPSWKDAIVYYAVIDRFADGNPANNRTATGVAVERNFHGGDLAGLSGQLYYLNSLGVNTVQISNPADNSDGAGLIGSSSLSTAFYGDWPTPQNATFTSGVPSPVPAVENGFGTGAVLKSLVSTAHSLEMRVISDFSVRHVHQESAVFNTHPDWFSVKSVYGQDIGWDAGVTDGWYTAFLPAFNFNLAIVRNWTQDNAMWWVREYGFDGITIDDAQRISTIWATEFSARAHSNSTRISVFSSMIVPDPQAQQAILSSKGLDGTFDYAYRAQLSGAALSRTQPISNFVNYLTANESANSSALLLHGLGTGDFGRSIHIANGQFGLYDAPATSFAQPTAAEPYERMGVAYAVIFTTVGVPYILYGDEIGLAGGASPYSYRDMQFTNINAAQAALRNSVTKLAQIRKTNPVLSRGTRTDNSVGTDTWVYTMTYQGQQLTMAVNVSDNNRTVIIPTGSYTDLISGSLVTGSSTSLAPRGFVVLKAN